jgi:adenylylsulfate kinase-like enzyme
MKPDTAVKTVWFTALSKADFPELVSKIRRILHRNGVRTAFLKGTRDY